LKLYARRKGMVEKWKDGKMEWWKNGMME